MAQLQHNSSLFLEDCTLLNNSVEDSVGVIHLDKGARDAGPSRVAVAGGTQTGNTPETLIATHSDGSAFATPPLNVWNELTQNTNPSLALLVMPEGFFATGDDATFKQIRDCLLYTSPSPRDRQKSRMPSSA